MARLASSGRYSSPSGGSYSSGGHGGGRPVGSSVPSTPTPSPAPIKIGVFAGVISGIIAGLLGGLLIRTIAIFADIFVFLPQGTLRLVGAATLVGAVLGTLVGIKRGGGATAVRGVLLIALVLGVLALAVGWLGSLLPFNTWLGFPLCGAVIMAVVTLPRLLRRS